MKMSPGNRRREWHVDKRLSVSALIATLTALVSVVAVAVSLQERVQQVEQDICFVSSELDSTRKTHVQVQRLEERMVAVQGVLEEIRLDVREMRNQRLTATAGKRAGIAYVNQVVPSETGSEPARQSYRYRRRGEDDLQPEKFAAACYAYRMSLVPEKRIGTAVNGDLRAGLIALQAAGGVGPQLLSSSRAETLPESSVLQDYFTGLVSPAVLSLADERSQSANSGGCKFEAESHVEVGYGRR
ncbi:hypothetical protein [Oleidesulfovibrio sp.]|uniref:hypothetical protein n=1 Tax=Oleidesulfovibrio sp. TaxID=2909707 RepID=UPI003A88BE68